MNGTDCLSDRRKVAGVLLALLLVLANPLLVHAQTDRSSWTITKIADIDTDLPNWPGGVYREYLEPSISNDVISFKCSAGGGGWPYFTIYTKSLDGDFVAHVDNTTHLPGTEVCFWGANGLSLSDGFMAFAGTCANPYHRGIYKKNIASNDISIVINEETDIPGGVGKFNTMYHEIPSIKSETIAFFGLGTTGIYQEGIYAEVDGALMAVADLNTEMPDHVGLCYEDFDIHPSSGGDYVSFVGYGGGYVNRGVYRYSIANDLIEVVANELTDMPNGSGVFSAFSSPVSDGSSCAFRGFEQGTDRHGVFTYIDGELDVVAMTGESIPETPDRYIGGIGLISIDGCDVAFAATWGGSYGYKSILARSGAVLTKVIDSDMDLEGKTIGDIVISRQSLSDDKIVFVVHFTDSTWGIYLATLDSPPAEAQNAEESAGTFRLRSGGPNPFVGSTWLCFDLWKAGRVDLSVYAPNGRKIVTLIEHSIGSGTHRAEWDGRDQKGDLVPAGVYFVRLRQGVSIASDRLVVLR